MSVLAQLYMFTWMYFYMEFIKRVRRYTYSVYIKKALLFIASSKTHQNKVDKVHFSQIWLLWGAGEARRALHPADQHLQREDLHLPLVLDAHPWRPHRPRRHLPICSLHLLLTPHLPLQAALQKVSSTNLPLRSSIENVLCVRGYQSIYAFSHLCLYCHLSFDSLRIIGSNQRVHCCSSPSPLQ